MTRTYTQLREAAQGAVNALREAHDRVYDLARACFPMNGVPPGVVGQFGVWRGEVKQTQEDMVALIEAIGDELRRTGVIKPDEDVRTEQEISDADDAQRAEWDAQSAHRPRTR